MSTILQSVRRFIRWLVLLLVLVAAGWLVIEYYSFIFSKKVRGVVVDVERVVEPTALIGRGLPAEQVFSYAIMLRTEDGTIYSSSSEDRQWAVVKKDYCVEARLYPYPPWDLEKANTYHNARLLKVVDCSQMNFHAGDMPKAFPTPTPEATPMESASE